MGKTLKQNLPMQEEINIRKTDPNWSKELASCVIRRYKEEEGNRTVVRFPVRNVLAAAAVLLLGVSIGWFAVSGGGSLNPEEDMYHGVSLLLDGDSYLSSLEE
ncbi:hypothetical protein EHQ53_12400 [Leptospira langatensis]|uniref:Uncharacterized protein n=1 Tax=Leptospira langatensis TaxID=2484983 RepID=A0A5F1ZQN8_9LEPT|nr:hypothetical protein [Leptospira langatensis]TGK02811.1 hypothetical protein EHO57_05710 [Leptospira langatensis]TGL39984.1 hypothetical protein EHQ53_12400 [Leptospira langatensis]